jgi:hypothetical protein
MFGECLGLRHYSLSNLIKVPRVRKTHLEIRCFLTCGRVEIPTLFHVLRGMDSPVPWRYLWVVRFNDHEVLRNYLFLPTVLSLGQSLGLSGRASEHVVTYIRTWSVTPTCPL